VELCFVCAVGAVLLHRLMDVDGRCELDMSISIGGSAGKALRSHCEKRLVRELGVPARAFAVTAASGWKGSRFSVEGFKEKELADAGRAWWPAVMTLMTVGLNQLCVGKGFSYARSASKVESWSEIGDRGIFFSGDKGETSSVRSGRRFSRDCRSSRCVRSRRLCSLALR